MNNGMYIHHFRVIITATSHDECKAAASRFKSLCKAWDFCVTISESKSARIDDVLERVLYIIHTDYAQRIIAFSESIRCINEHLTMRRKVTVNIEELEILPTNGFTRILDKLQ